MGRAILRDELLARGYTYKPLQLERLYKQYFAPDGRLIISKGAYYDYPFVSQTTKVISKSKALSYQFAALNDISIPATIRTSDFEEARSFLNRYKKLVVKPEHLGGGKGLTVDITTEDDLKAALTKATVDGLTPLVQEQFIGEEIRFTVIGGVVRSAILRQTPRVRGDGKSTVSELIEVENIQRKSLVFPTLSYPQLDATKIDEKYLKSDRVLEPDEELEFSRATMIRNGASFYGVLHEVHPAYIALVEGLASQINPPFLVVDLMIKHWKQAPEQGSYVFLEFNTAPGLEVYTSLRGGDTPDVIAAIADQIDTYAQLNS